MPSINDDWAEYPSTANKSIPARKDTGLTVEQYAIFHAYGSLPHARGWRAAEWLMAMRAARLATAPEPTAAMLAEVRLLERELAVTALSRRAARIRWRD